MNDVKIQEHNEMVLKEYIAEYKEVVANRDAIIEKLAKELEAKGVSVDITGIWALMVDRKIP